MRTRQKLVLELDKPTQVRFLYDQPRTGEGAYGPWYAYTVEADGTEYVFFTAPQLHHMLQQLGIKKDTQVTMTRRVVEQNGKPHFYHTITLGERTFSTMEEIPHEAAQAARAEMESAPELSPDFFGLMGQCLQESLNAWRRLDIEFNSDNVQGVASTLFIQLCNRGFRRPVETGREEAEQ
jgi:hypothetical protein